VVSTNLTIFSPLRFHAEKTKKGKKHEGKLRRANTAKLEEK
jgi:hypothetical protein